MSLEISSDVALIKQTGRTYQKKTILGLGVACVDIIACVDTYPEPDEKIRADSVQLFSGGNVGNTLTAISRLGAANTKVLTKVGSDPNGELVLNDFRNAMIDVEDVIISTSAATLLVYVIVDKQARRTCIASPNEEELTPSEIASKLSVRSQMLGPLENHALFDNVQLVHFDSRHTEAAIVLAESANKQNIVVSIDVEKNRAHLKDLLPLCDIFFTNKEFPELYFKDHMRSGFKCVISPLENETLEDIKEFDSVAFHNALLAMSFLFCGDCPLNGISTDIKSRAHMVVTTRGALGSLLMRRRDSGHSLESFTEDGYRLQKDGSFSHSTLDSNTEKLLRSAPLEIQQFYFTRISPHGYSTQENYEEVFEVSRCGAWPVKQEDIVDTTGAGDAFIGGFITGWSIGYSDELCMKLGTTTAAAKLSKIGAREGLPTQSEVDRRLSYLISN